MQSLNALKAQARRLKQQALTVYFVARDPRTPLLVRALALLIAAYALSPIDLIPDFIPVLGYLDDLVLIPLGIALMIRLTPAEILDGARDQARLASDRPVSYAAGAGIVLIWLLALALVGRWAYSLLR